MLSPILEDPNDVENQDAASVLDVCTVTINLYVMTDVI